MRRAWLTEDGKLDVEYLRATYPNENVPVVNCKQVAENERNPACTGELLLTRGYMPLHEYLEYWVCRSGAIMLKLHKCLA